MANKISHEFSENEVLELFLLPFNDLIFKAASIHRQNQNPNQVQISTLLSIKTGSCPEDCKYCPQSAHYNTGLKKESLIDLSSVLEAANKAREAGASRFCMGAAWRNLNDRDLEKVCQMVSAVKEIGLETCLTVGMINETQSKKLKSAGLDYYNHNIDSSPEFYQKIISTRSFQDRLDTIKNVRNANIKLCCGGIVGMGESRNDRARMLMTLANMPKHPESVPINMLVKIAGTPLENSEEIDQFEFIRTIAVARILMPKSFIRLSAGRLNLNESGQALSFLAGANSIFYGDKLLTTENPETKEDLELFSKLGIQTI